MAFDPTFIPPKMSRWTPEGIITCLEEVGMEIDCAVVCLVDVLSKEGEDKLAIIQQAESDAEEMMTGNNIPVTNPVILRQIMADIYDSAEEAVRRWGE